MKEVNLGRVVGKDAIINGVNSIKIEQGENIKVEQIEDTLTISFSGINGVSEHDEINGRDALNQHPIESISGLSSTILAINSSIGTINTSINETKTNLENTKTDVSENTSNIQGINSKIQLIENSLSLISEAVSKKVAVLVATNEADAKDKSITDKVNMYTWGSRVDGIYYNGIEIYKRPVYFTTINEMKDGALFDGDVVATGGFYLYNDGGGASYSIETTGIADDITIFALSNGLFAHLITSSVMNILQFGAVNVSNIFEYTGTEDNAPKIQSAVNSDIGILNFPEDGNFRIASPIVITKNNFTINGNNSTLFTDNNYPTPIDKYLEHVTFESCNNLTWDKLNIVELQTKVIIDVVTQIMVKRSNEVYITDSTLRGPGPWLVKGEDNKHLFEDPNYVPMSYGGERFNHNNIDLYTGWSDVTIAGCDMFLSQDGPAGLSIMARDISGLGASGAVIENNYVEKVCHDEILAIGMPNAILSDIIVRNNTFIMYDGKASSSITGVLVGQETTSEPTDNVLLENNTFDLQTTRYSVRADRLLNENSLVMVGNTFNIKKGSGYEGGTPTALQFFGSATGDYIVIDQNNIINVDNTNVNMIVNSIFAGDFDVRNQIININGSLSGGVGEEVRTLNDCTIKCTGQLATVARDVDVVTGNDVTANNIKFAFERYDKDIDKTIDYSNNILKNESSTIMYLIYGQSTALTTTSGYINANNNSCILGNTSTRNALIALRGTVPTPAFKLLSVVGCTAENLEGVSSDFAAAFPLMSGITEDYIER